MQNMGNVYFPIRGRNALLIQLDIIVSLDCFFFFYSLINRRYTSYSYILILKLIILGCLLRILRLASVFFRLFLADLYSNLLTISLFSQILAILIFMLHSFYLGPHPSLCTSKEQWSAEGSHCPLNTYFQPVRFQV